MNASRNTWHESMRRMPLIAILRGIETDECEAVAMTLFDAGFEILEIPLNSPDACGSIARLTRVFPDRFIGAGTVTTAASAKACLDAGARIVVAPNLDAEVAQTVKAAQTVYCPGVATPTEAFAALELGADLLKLFPAEMISPAVVKALRAVLPRETLLAPVGGISPDNMAAYLDAGADGFGIGSALYRPGKPLEQVRQSAETFIAAFQAR